MAIVVEDTLNKSCLGKGKGQDHALITCFCFCFLNNPPPHANKEGED